MKNFALYLYYYQPVTGFVRHINLEENVDVYTNMDEFLASDHEYKMAVVQPEYWNQGGVRHVLDQLKDIDEVILYSIELSDDLINKAIKIFDLPNFKFVIPGDINFKLKHATVLKSYYWLGTTSYMYYYIMPELIQKKHNSFKEKEHYFEVMYGIEKPHRSFVANYIDENLNADDFFQLPFLNVSSISNESIEQDINPGSIWEDEIVWNDDGTLNYFKAVNPMPSTIIPFKIYDKAAYSLVCETQYSNKYSFFTEKIAKPILASRLFIVISGQHYLRNLRRLGFKTFDGIIDESYDKIANDKKRWTAAMNEVQKLCQRDQMEVLKECADIFIHNYRTMYEYRNNNGRRENFVEDAIDRFVIFHGK